jgi:hypothetical protein
MDTELIKKFIERMIEDIAQLTAEQNGMDWDKMPESEDAATEWPSRNAYRKDAREIINREGLYVKYPSDERYLVRQYIPITEILSE